MDLEQVLSDLELDQNLKNLSTNDAEDSLISSDDKTSVTINKICDAIGEKDSYFNSKILEIVKSCLEKELPLLVEDYCRKSLKSTIQKVLHQEIQNINKDFYS